MLRVLFQASNERKFQKIMQGLGVLSDRLQRSTRGDGLTGFTIYNVSRIKAGRDEGVSVEMVEIHNDEDCLFSSSQQQVVGSILQSGPDVDAELAALASDRGAGHDPCRYCMFPGHLFSGAPGALAFVARGASQGVSAQCPTIIHISASSSQITALLDTLNQLADIAARLPGVVACLSQGIGRCENIAGLLFMFATDMELVTFTQDAQATRLVAAAKQMAGECTVQFEGEAAKFAHKAATAFVDAAMATTAGSRR